MHLCLPRRCAGQLRRLHAAAVASPADAPAGEYRAAAGGEPRETNPRVVRCSGRRRPADVAADIPVALEAAGGEAIFCTVNDTEACGRALKALALAGEAAAQSGGAGLKIFPR